MKKLFSKFYTPTIEDWSTRILYFMNTLDSYFLVSGLFIWLLCKEKILFIPTLLCLILAVGIFNYIADFHPYFIFLSLPGWWLLLQNIGTSGWGKIFLVSFLFLLATLYLFIGIPNSIISRDPRVGFIIIFNSLFTVAPTICSFPISYFYSTVLGIVLLKVPNLDTNHFFLFWLTLFLAAVLTYILREKNTIAEFGRYPNSTPYFRRVVLLNIDGCRFDYVKKFPLPYKTFFQEVGGYFENGLRTIYRALTNPAFSSILTGVPSEIHRVKHNRFDQHIKVEALPDYIPSILYGSMHVKHFSKSHWKTKIVSLPKYSIYKADNIIFDWLKDDIQKEDKTKLFIVDLSEADFLGHCYGGYSKQYLAALERTFERIGKFFEWCKNSGVYEDTALIICSDHGIAVIDHSYLLFPAETFVPFFVLGKRISPFTKSKICSIMDICNTICHLLGVRYPKEARGTLLFNIDNLNSDADRFFTLIKQEFHQLSVQEKKNDLYQNWLNGELSYYTREKLFQNRNLQILIIDLEGISNALIQVLRNRIYEKLKIVLALPGKQMPSQNGQGMGSNLSFLSIEELLRSQNSAFDLIFLIGVLHNYNGGGFSLGVLEKLLKEKGWIVGSLEPNSNWRDSFRCRSLRYFLHQFEVAPVFPQSILTTINKILTAKFSQPIILHPEELLLVTEDHSGLVGSPKKNLPTLLGDLPEQYLTKELPNCELTDIEYYSSSFSCWQNKLIAPIIKLTDKVSLFRYTLRKK